MEGEITHLLAQIAAGDDQARQALLPLIYGDLKKRARRLSAREFSPLTLGTTGLLHECYLRLLGDHADRFQNRRHFFAAAAEAMRRILIERTRSLARLKRGGGAEHVELDADHAGETPMPDEVLALDQLLSQLEGHDSDMATVVKLRYFGGMSVEETAEALSMSPRSVNRAWTAARAWLKLHWIEGDGTTAPL
jgi:RNA polymerase sigma factor (TIGR02999 family)